MADIINHALFDKLVSEAIRQDFRGWDFSYLHGRWSTTESSWDYRAIVQSKLPGINSLLDIDTGGGEFLASLQPLPHVTVALEAYPQNIAVAQQRLEPLGVQVLPFTSYAQLPLDNRYFELAINRHGGLAAGEVYRILQEGGELITQQVGGRHYHELNRLIDPGIVYPYADWTLDYAVRQLQVEGFLVVEQREEFQPAYFYDIGALIYYLRAVPWQIAGFSVEKYYDRLAELHNLIQQRDSMVVHSHHFFIHAHK